MSNHINEIVAELNDADSLTRSELDATEILPLLPIGKEIRLKTPDISLEGAMQSSLNNQEAFIKISFRKEGL